jgi:hypothetical protein
LTHSGPRDDFQFVPQQTLGRLLDDLVGAQQCRSWHVGAARLGSLKIEDELEFRCPLVRKIGGMAPLGILSTKNAVWRSAPFQWPLVVKNTLATLYGEEVQQGKKAGQLSDPCLPQKWTILS